MTALVTLTVAKEHLRVDHTDDDADIQRKIEQASWIIVDYLKTTEEEVIVKVPAPVLEAATVMMLTHLYDYRDPGQPDNDIALGYLPKAITSILHRFRDPALA